MNIQQLINVFGNFIDSCANDYDTLLTNKDRILDRLFYLNPDSEKYGEGLFFSNSEIFGRQRPKSNFLNYIGIDASDETKSPRNFFAFHVLRYNRMGVHSLDDIVRAVQIAQNISTVDNPLYFYNGDEEYPISNQLFRETELLTLDDKVIESIDQLAPHLSICSGSTESEQILTIQLNSLYQVFLKYNEEGR